MRCEAHVRFLGGGGAAMRCRYPTFVQQRAGAVTRMSAPMVGQQTLASLQIRPSLLIIINASCYKTLTGNFVSQSVERA